jgi:hypothetical protein
VRREEYASPPRIFPTILRLTTSGGLVAFAQLMRLDPVILNVLSILTTLENMLPGVLMEHVDIKVRFDFFFLIVNADSICSIAVPVE